MSAASYILRVFLHSPPPIFTADSVENHEKSRNSTTYSVDNYVDGVDRIVYIHQNAKNIYTTCFMRNKQAVASQKGRNCKTGRKNAGFSRCVPW